MNNAKMREITPKRKILYNVVKKIAQKETPGETGG